MTTPLFYAFGLVAIVSALVAVVPARGGARAAIGLFSCLASLAGIAAILGAGLLAALQLLIAVAVFTVMLVFGAGLQGHGSEISHAGLPSLRRRVAYGLTGIVAAMGFAFAALELGAEFPTFTEMSSRVDLREEDSLDRSRASPSPQREAGSPAEPSGLALGGESIYPSALAGLVLLSAIVGGTALLREEGD